MHNHISSRRGRPPPLPKFFRLEPPLRKHFCRCTTPFHDSSVHHHCELYPVSTCRSENLSPPLLWKGYAYNYDIDRSNILARSDTIYVLLYVGSCVILLARYLARGTGLYSHIIMTKVGKGFRQCKVLCFSTDHYRRLRPCSVAPIT